VDAGTKARTVLDVPNTGMPGSNPARDIDYVCILLLRYPV